jgi:hypothetical protein
MLRRSHFGLFELGDRFQLVFTQSDRTQRSQPTRNERRSIALVFKLPSNETSSLIVFV